MCPVYENMLFLTVTLKPSRQSECLTVNIRGVAWDFEDVRTIINFS